jgi:NAD(P)-dependent dehydrogenase (short-subunit alcohol dehydrogenase family)
MYKKIAPEIQLHEEALGQTPGRQRMRGRRVLVVGAGQRPGPDLDILGNGRAISLLIAREGASVVCADMSLESAQATADMIVSKSRRGTEDRNAVETEIERLSSPNEHSAAVQQCTA